ncbi:F-box protein [Tetrabaena socialis]|uniref:F-box protein n=1 Tax=Tetrabaena socialis TaxID=47790 RepID=A0A2J7ZMM0_9CHLO|nr:F-box protein [Tetrabaena socialis]|eukprot:PNH01513.1 F-box protein [Tetrabaena socialis]
MAAPSPLVELTDDLAARVLLCLRPRDVCCAALCCKRLAAVCRDDARIWAPLCAAHWAAHTSPERWLAAGAAAAAAAAAVAGPSALPPAGAGGASFGEEDEEAGEAPPTTYRAVFATLRRLQPLIGMWRGPAGDQPAGSLFRVGWAAGGAGHVEVVALRGGRNVTEVVSETTARVGPAYPGVSIQQVDETAAAAAPRPRGPPPTRVVAVFPGQGRVAGTGFSNPTWIEGRLWVYDNGSIGFLWRGEFDFLLDMERMQMGPPPALGRGGTA